MSRKIQLKRGLEVDLPTLAEAELGFTTDSQKTFIGSSKGNIQIANQSDVDERKKLFFSDVNRALLYTLLSNLNKAKGRVSFVGDSITEGNANGGHPWFEALQPLFPNVTFINNGHGGKTTLDFINNYMTEVTTSGATLFVIALGTNDIRYINHTDGTQGATTATQYVTNMTTIINQLKPLGDVVVINPWMTTWKDYESSITTNVKEQAYFDYCNALRSYCATNLIPYINTNDELKEFYHDLQAIGQWNGDGVHPNSPTGTKLYSYSALYGNQKRMDYIQAPYKALGKYVYKLVILSHYGDGFDRVALQTLAADVTILDIFGNSQRNLYNNPSPLIQAYSSTFAGYLNPDGQYPFTLTFSTATPITKLRNMPSNFMKGIGNYEFYVSENQYAIVNPDHESWKLIDSNFETGYYKRSLYHSGLKPKYFYKLVIKSAFDVSGVVSLKAMSMTQDILTYYSDLTGQPLERLFDANDQAIQISGFPINIIVSSAKPCTNFNLSFNNGLSVKDWEIWQSDSYALINAPTSAQWIKTRSGTASNSGDFFNVTTQSFDVRTLTQQNAPAQMTGSEDLPTTITKLNSLMTQLKATGLLI